MILLLLSVDAHMAVPRFFVSSECLHNVILILQSSALLPFDTTN